MTSPSAMRDMLKIELEQAVAAREQARADAEHAAEQPWSEQN
jgi:hypothetical protein